MYGGDATWHMTGPSSGMSNLNSPAGVSNDSVQGVPAGAPVVLLVCGCELWLIR